MVGADVNTSAPDQCPSGTPQRGQGGGYPERHGPVSPPSLMFPPAPCDVHSLLTASTPNNPDCAELL